MPLNKLILSLAVILTFSIVTTGLGMTDTLLAEPDTDQKIEVKVDGLTCIFCAYSLESKFTDLDSIKDLEIKVTDGLMTFTLLSGHEFTDEEIKKRVEDAGFTPRDITRTPTGQS